MTTPAEPSSCRFCQIVSGTAEASRILVAGEAVAFLDSRPLFRGHTLVVPPPHVPNMLELPPDDIGGFFAAVQKIARAVERGLGAEGTFIAMNNKVSQSVPHLHVHVIPRRHKDGLRGFFWPREKYASDAERDEYAARIAAAL